MIVSANIGCITHLQSGTATPVGALDRAGGPGVGVRMGLMGGCASWLSLALNSMFPRVCGMVGQQPGNLDMALVLCVVIGGIFLATL